jgi:threonine dehydratase
VTASLTNALSSDSIRRAQTLINPVFLRSPFYRAESVSAALGCNVVLKIETLNPIRCFKGRGADYFMSDTPEERFVCASAGNFAQGLAFAARERKRSVIAFVPAATAPNRIARLRQLGAEVRCEGSDYDDAKLRARTFAAESGLPFVEDGVQPAISEGAGTIGLEITGSGEHIDTVVVPLGGGALLAGIARWFKDEAPNVEVIGAAPAAAPAMAMSWKARAVVTSKEAATRAAGLAIRVPAAEAVSQIAATADDVLLFDESRLDEAIRMIRDETMLDVEPSGAAAIAVLAQHRQRFQSRNVAVIITGANP